MKRANELYKAAIKELARHGIRAICHRGGAHEIISWTGKNGIVYSQAIACTPSGARAHLNQRSQIRRKLREGGFQL